MATWYPGSGLTWHEYLQASAFTGDIRGEIAQQARFISARLQDDTGQLVGTMAQLESAFSKGADAIATGVDRLGAQFEYSLGLVFDELHIQTQHLEKIVQELDSIKRTLQSPLLTQARELFWIGRDRMAKGLLDKALQAFHEAERKNDTDFFTQYYLGKLYLNGRDDDDDVIDPGKAKQHLIAAARYAKAEIQANPEFKLLAAEALFYGSLACFALAGDENELDIAQLQEAYSLVTEALRLEPSLTEAWFHAAKYKALEGRTDKCIAVLEVAVKRDPRYSAKALADGAFLRVRPALEQLVKRLRDTAMAEAEAAIREATEALERSQRYPSWRAEDGLRLHDLAGSALSLAQAAQKTATYFGALEALEAAKKSRHYATASFQSRALAETQYQAAEEQRKETEQANSELRQGKEFAWIGLVSGIGAVVILFLNFSLAAVVSLAGVAALLAISFGAAALLKIPKPGSDKSDRLRAGWAIGLGAFGCCIEVFLLIALMSR